MKTICSVLIALVLVPSLGLARAATEPGFFSTRLSEADLPRSGSSENLDVGMPHPVEVVASPLVQQTESRPSLIHGRRESPGPSSRRTAMVLSEVHHQPPPDGDGQDLRFIELYNSNPFTEDLSGWFFTGDVDYRIPEGTVVPGLGYLVVAPRPTDIARAYRIELPLGGFSTRLGPGRGLVRLHKRSGAIVLQVEFTADDAWETGSQGGGATRVLARPSLGEANPLAWSSSVFIGGSPGRPEPELPSDLSGIALNELLAPSAGATNCFVEIHNRGPLPANLSHAVLTTSPSFETYAFPTGSLLAAGDFLVLDGPEIAALLPPYGNSLHLLSPDRQRVLDSIRYPGQWPGSSYGRVHDFASRWDATVAPTPGFPNTSARRPDIVFSEIHFESLGDDENEEFVEIHNRSSNIVSLDGWRLDGGVTFSFSPGTFLEPGSFLAIARNPGRCRELHPDVPPGRFVGGFDGSLRNRGERLTLLRPVPRTNDSAAPGSPHPVGHLAVEDTIHYQPTGRGHAWAAGGGSSLERTDFDTPTGDLQAWRASDETSKTSWTTVQSTGALTLTHPGVPSADQLQILLLGPGEALVDDVEVIVNGNNRIANGQFESGTNTWVFQGTHRTSRVEPGTGPDGSRALHVIASDRGDHVANRIRTPLTRPIPANGIATIRAKLRWLAGHPEILFRLRNGGLEAVGRLASSTATGSPGAPNSPAIAPSAPSITELQHHPVLPAANQAVRVVARVSDPHGVSQVHLVYRRDPSTNLTSVPMSDDGLEPDEFAGDSIFTGAIAGQPTGSMVAFRVVAEDGLGNRSVHPRSDNAIPREALVRFGESPSTGTFGSYRIWMTAAARDAWTRREKMSNEDIAVTFVSGTDRSIYDAGAHYSGSSYTSPIYDSPTGALCGYDLTFPEDDRFLGADRATLDWPIRDDTNQRETLMFWFLEQYGLPNLHRRHVRLTVNGVRRGSIYDDVQQPDGDTVEQWYPDDAAGSLWKTDCWNEFDNAGNRIDPCILNSLERFPSTGAKKAARYRWNWRPRAVQSSANDFTDLFALVDAANASTDYVPTVEALVDVGHWMRTFAMNDLASYWDAFGNPNSKNSFLYKPRHNRWQIFCWDFDVGLGVFNDPPTAALFDVSDPTIARMYRTPAFMRRYWAALQEATDNWFRIGGDSPIDRLLDSKYAAFQAQGIGLAHPGSIKNWIRQRRTFLLQQLARVQSDFAITSNSGRDFTSTEETTTLSGFAPVTVATLRIQGRERTIDWTTVSNWSARVGLQPGINTLQVDGFDRSGMPVPGASDSIRVTYSGAPAALPQIRINEWLARNSNTLTNPATGQADDWFELHNAGTTPVDLSGYTLTDRLSAPDRSIIPAGIQLPSGGFLLVWADDRPEASRPGADLHVGFQLAQDGELIALYDTLGRLIDSVSFPPQLTDQSEGRWPDGELPPFLRFPSPSPGRPNTTPPSPPDSFRVTAGWNPEDARIRITWRSVSGRRYQPEFTEDLQNPRWEALGTPIVATTDITSATDSGPFRVQRYYRVVLLR